LQKELILLKLFQKMEQSTDKTSSNNNFFIQLKGAHFGKAPFLSAFV
jgi:hypothetical protein